jgi:hypothetical protein
MEYDEDDKVTVSKKKYIADVKLMKEKYIIEGENKMKSVILAELEINFPFLWETWDSEDLQMIRKDHWEEFIESIKNLEIKK